MHYFDSLDLFSVFHSEGAVGAQEQWASSSDYHRHIHVRIYDYGDYNRRDSK